MNRVFVCAIRSAMVKTHPPLYLDTVLYVSSGRASPLRGEEGTRSPIGKGSPAPSLPTGPSHRVSLPLGPPSSQVKDKARAAVQKLRNDLHHPIAWRPDSPKGGKVGETRRRCAFPVSRCCMWGVRCEGMSACEKMEGGLVCRSAFVSNISQMPNYFCGHVCTTVFYHPPCKPPVPMFS